MLANAMMGMKTMLMGDSLDHFLSDLISFGDLSQSQKVDIVTISNRFKFEYDPHEKMQQSLGETNLFSAVEVVNELPGENLFGGANPTDSVASDTDEEDDEDGVNSKSGRTHSGEDFSTEESKQALRDYLLSQLARGQLSEETAEIIASTLGLGALFETGSLVAVGALLNGPVEKGYNGEGHLERVGRWNGLSTDPNYFYNGIWGYATGKRLICCIFFVHQISYLFDLLKFSRRVQVAFINMFCRRQSACCVIAHCTSSLLLVAELHLPKNFCTYSDFC